MRIMPKPNLAAAMAVWLAASSWALAEDAKSLQRKLEAQYPLTVINAEGATVTQGAVLQLKKGLTGGTNRCSNDYKDGRVTLGGNVLLKASCARLGASETTTARGFVPGEVMSVIRIEVKDGITFELISEPFGFLRYRADLKFQVPKGTVPDLAEANRMIFDVFNVLGPNGQPQSQNLPPGPPPAGPAPLPATPAAAQQPLPEIAPPPPPPDAPAGGTVQAAEPPPPPAPAPPASQQQPATLKLGLTIDQVVSVLGQPATIADLGSKKIYTYKNPEMKVIFVDGKVADMQ